LTPVIGWYAQINGRVIGFDHGVTGRDLQKAENRRRDFVRKTTLTRKSHGNITHKEAFVPAI
jgi:hypothetical protein